MLQKIFIFWFLLWLTSMVGQHRSSKYLVANLPRYDEQLIHYGVVLGLNYGTYRAKPSAYFYESNSAFQRMEPSGTVGFTVGGIFNLRLHDQLDVRALVQYCFYQRGIAYTMLDASNTSIVNLQTPESSIVELPILFKYKSIRRRNFRMYVTGGVKPSYSLSNKNKDQAPDQLRFKNLDFAIDYGLGCDIYFPFFKLAPEIRFSSGLLDMMAPDPNQYAMSLQKLKSQGVVFVLNFE